jgi:hypothetical protein
VQVCDTAELIRSCPDLDWDAVLRRARASGALRMLLLSVLLASELLDADVPEPVRRLSRTDPVVPELAADVGRRLFPPPADAGRVLPIGVGMPPKVDSWFYLRARERLRDRIGYLVRLLWTRLSLLVTPTDSDRTWIRLPQGLGLLYYVVRPARVLLQGIRTGHLKSPPVTPDGAPPCESVRASARS